MKRDEHGIALVITLFLMATLSALAVSMMFLAQTETAASRNYRTMSQARYAAEAGVHEMANYLMNTGYSPTSNYDATKSPVTCTGGSCAHTQAGSCTPTSIATAVSTGCVVFGYSAATSNNPDAAVHTPTASTLAVNSSGSTTNAAAGTVTYTAAAILLSTKSVTVYGGGTSNVQTWQIVSDGTVPPSTSAIVEVSSTIEREVGYATTYAVFATNALCGAITISGNASTDSYTSAGLGTTASAWSGGAVGSGTPLAPGSQGGIGTNGNLNVGGSVAIGGTLSTPRTGAGACSNSNVDAITGSGSWSYGGTHQLSQSVSYPTPTIPSGIPTSSVSISSGDTLAACIAKVSASGWTCAISGHQVTLSPLASSGTTLTLGNVSVASNTNLVIAGPAGATGTTSTTLNVNSFVIGNNASFSLADGSLSTYPKANVMMNIAGQSLGSSLPLDLSGGGDVNTDVATGVVGVSTSSGYDPSRFQIAYAGTAEIDMVGNNSISATVYAPNAFVKTVGHGNVYGSILASTFTDTGGAKINYDTSLSTKFTTLGNFMLTSFSWKKY